MSSDSEVLHTVSFPADAEFAKDDTYNFEKLDLPRRVCIPLADAFVGVTSHYRTVSRRQAWRSLLRFAEFLRGTGDAFTSLYRSNVLEQFAAHLSQRRLKKTNGSHYNFVVALYRWSAINSRDAMRWQEIRLLPQNFKREETNVRANDLSAQDLKEIAEACKSEILKSRARLNAGKASKEHCRSGLSDKDAKQLGRIRNFRVQGKYTQRQLSGAGISLRGLSLRRLSSYEEHNTEALLPYLLLLLIATAANPSSMMNLQVGSLEDHPADPLLKRIYWAKYRSSREQFCDVKKAGVFSVPTLLDELREATSKLREIAHPQFKSYVFLARIGSSARVPCVQGFHNALASFRERHSLAKFSFVDIRRSIARAMARKGASQEAVRRTLQHSSVRTTQTYLGGVGGAVRARKDVLAFQVQLVKESLAKHLGKTYETAYGFRCIDGRYGRAEGSRSGEPCLEFSQCATCVNAIFVLDSAEHVARMLRARVSLEEFRTRCEAGDGSIIRFKAKFLPTLEVVNALLSDVSPEVMSKALTISLKMPRLPLEE